MSELRAVFVFVVRIVGRGLRMATILIVTRLLEIGATKIGEHLPVLTVRVANYLELVSVGLYFIIGAVLDIGNELAIAHQEGRTILKRLGIGKKRHGSKPK